MSGRRSRNKGARIEREIVRALQGKGDSMVDTTKTRTSNEAASAIPDAGSPEIEITPAMIEAGVAVLWDSGAVEVANLGADQELVREIFVAMSHALKARSWL